jgi:hypothetical protein
MNEWRTSLKHLIRCFGSAKTDGRAREAIMLMTFHVPRPVAWP